VIVSSSDLTREQSDGFVSGTGTPEARVGLSYGTPPQPPPAVRWIGYLSLAIGYFGLTLKPVALAPLFFDLRRIKPDYVAPQYTPAEFTYVVLYALIGAAVSAVALAGGLGVLKMRPWGRTLLLAYATCAVVLTLVTAAYGIAQFDRATELVVASSTQPVDVPRLRNFQMFFLVSGTLARLLWPAILLTVLTRPHVKRAFGL